MAGSHLRPYKQHMCNRWLLQILEILNINLLILKAHNFYTQHVIFFFSNLNSVNASFHIGKKILFRDVAPYFFRPRSIFSKLASDMWHLNSQNVCCCHIAFKTLSMADPKPSLLWQTGNKNYKENNFKDNIYESTVMSFAMLEKI